MFISLNRHHRTSSLTLLPDTDQSHKQGNRIDQIITKSAMTIVALDGKYYSDCTYQTLENLRWRGLPLLSMEITYK